MDTIEPERNINIQSAPESPSRIKITEVFHLEDDLSLAVMTRRFLEKGGITTVDHSGNFPDALAKLQARQKEVEKGTMQPYPWAILDFDVPGGNDGKIVEVFHTISPSTAITVVTGRSVDDRGIAALREKGINFSHMLKGGLRLEDYLAQKERAEKILNSEQIKE